MTFTTIAGLKGFDVSRKKEELNILISELETKICNYFTDDFSCFVKTIVGPDCIVKVEPARSKIIIKLDAEYDDIYKFYETSGFSHEFFRLMVLEQIFSSIKDNYGLQPFKEAKNILNKFTKPNIKKELVKFTVIKIRVEFKELIDSNFIMPLVVNAFGDSGFADNNNKVISIGLLKNNLKSDVIYKLWEERKQNPNFNLNEVSEEDLNLKSIKEFFLIKNAGNVFSCELKVRKNSKTGKRYYNIYLYLQH